MIFGAGCLKSKLDGTEKKFNVTDMKTPAEYSYMSVMPPIRNQGSTSMCVCYALTAYLDWKKNLKEKDNNGGQFDVNKLYSIRKDKNSEGMQIKEALSYLKHTGLGGMKINGYALVGSIEAMKQALIINGPVAIGTMVYEESQMSDFWNGVTLLGGHCTDLIGYNDAGFILRNSWGKSYGKNGYWILPYKDFKAIFEAWTIY